MTDPQVRFDESDADSPPSVMIAGLSPEDVSRLAYACDVLASHASSGDYRTWASTTAERLRSRLWDLANHADAPRVATGTDRSVIACSSVYHAWPAEDRRRFERCGTCQHEDGHTAKVQNFGWHGTLVICTTAGCDWSEIHEGGAHRRRAVRRAKHHIGIGPEVDDWGDPVEILNPVAVGQ